MDWEDVGPNSSICKCNLKLIGHIMLIKFICVELAPFSLCLLLVCHEFYILKRKS